MLRMFFVRLEEELPSVTNCRQFFWQVEDKEVTCENDLQESFSTLCFNLGIDRKRIGLLEIMPVNTVLPASLSHTVTIGDYQGSRYND
jgi:hypothetical protein